MVRLPTFLVIGAAKGGTTSLHAHLRQHPDIFVPAVKETNFYWTEAPEHGRRVPPSLDHYARCFAGARAERAIGEVSPQYLNSLTAAERIARDLPDVRLVASLRNPADRAYSDYLGRVRIARESRAIDMAIRPGERIFDDGLYYPRLKRYFDRFPRERIHIILHDDFNRDPGATLRGLFEFLDVDPGVPIDASARWNPAAAPRWPAVNRVLWTVIPFAQRLVPTSWRGTGLAEAVLRKTYRHAAPFPPELRRRLCAAYQDDVRATAKLIGRDLSAWLNAS